MDSKNTVNETWANFFSKGFLGLLYIAAFAFLPLMLFSDWVEEA